MTREEAIERLKTDIYKYADFTENPNENEFWMAFDLAIKALSTETCDDAISRQAVIKAIEEVGLLTCEYIDVKQAIESLPSVQPIRSKGEWERVTDKTGHLVWECKCGWQERLSTNFCPNCGKDMRGESEAE